MSVLGGKISRFCPDPGDLYKYIGSRKSLVLGCFLPLPGVTRFGGSWGLSTQVKCEMYGSSGRTSNRLFHFTAASGEKVRQSEIRFGYKICFARARLTFRDGGIWPSLFAESNSSRESKTKTSSTMIDDSIDALHHDACVNGLFFVNRWVSGYLCSADPVTMIQKRIILRKEWRAQTEMIG